MNNAGIGGAIVDNDALIAKEVYNVLCTLLVLLAGIPYAPCGYLQLYKAYFARVL